MKVKLVPYTGTRKDGGSGRPDGYPIGVDNLADTPHPGRGERMVKMLTEVDICPPLSM